MIVNMIGLRSSGTKIAANFHDNVGVDTTAMEMKYLKGGNMMDFIKTMDPLVSIASHLLIKLNAHEIWGQ
ncbi:hypothetical protein KI387_032867, partial [Taxus chinensis]